ncbi:MAG TPA: M23 family metallopeptidase [Opitutus sp.]|nr:M23 family metallopeptidase [Opitutus sp.]
MSGARVVGMLLVASLAARAGERAEIVWPTPNRAWAEGRPLREILQPTVSGEPESGGFGGVRSNGAQFHEGIDIKCVHRDRRGEPEDAVFAAMAGVVRHVSLRAGDSSYGRYIVIEHPEETPAVYTLYAHLAAVAPGVRPGVPVARGQVLGTMGHTSGGYTIPRERAHLHFEIGLVATRNFQAWYDSRKFGSRNEHGPWNGFNLMGIDPLDFLNDWRAHRVNTFLDYFHRMRPAARVRIATRRMPDFIERYPSLLTRPLPATIGGWEIEVNWTGLPFAWTPLEPTAVMGMPANRPVIVAADAEIERRERSKSVAVRRRGRWVVGADLETVLQQMFGAR